MRNLRNLLKLWLSRSLFVYDLRLCLDRSLKKAINQSTLVSTGLPRCGNTLLSRKLRICYIQFKQISHHHSIGHLRYVIRSGKPFIFCYRDPQDFIPSWHLKSGIPVKHLIEYSERYFDILKSAQNVLIIPFDEIISENTGYLENVGVFFNISSQGVKSELVKYANESIKLDNRDRLISTFPNEEKDRAKSKVSLEYKNKLEKLAQKALKVCVV